MAVAIIALILGIAGSVLGSLSWVVLFPISFGAVAIPSALKAKKSTENAIDRIENKVAREVNSLAGRMVYVAELEEAKIISQNIRIYDEENSFCQLKGHFILIDTEPRSIIIRQYYDKEDKIQLDLFDLADVEDMQYLEEEHPEVISEVKIKKMVLK